MNSKGMIVEAYAATKAAPPEREPKPVKAGWETSRVALEQMYRTNLISKATYLEHIEGMVP